jgi:hypothetical protein
VQPKPTTACAPSVAGVFLVVAIALAACGASGASPARSTVGSGATVRSTWAPSPAGTWGVEPHVVVPSAPPPTHLVEENLILGHGPVLKTGDFVTVQYVGVSRSSKDGTKGLPA